MLRFTFNLIFSLLLLGIVIVLIAAWFIVPTLPNIDNLKDVKLQVPLRIYSADLSLLAEFGDKRRTPVGIEAIPKQMIEAAIASEDDRFYAHPGVDWQGLLRASIALITTGVKKQGGSTITMQVARNFFLSPKKTYLRKAQEIFLALKIERELSKDEILELYLNKVYLGQRAYGVDAAAHIYYGSDIQSLKLPQIAMIIGLLKAPSRLNPITNPERALIRRNYVLQRMFALSYITTDEYETAKNAPISASLHTPSIAIEAAYVTEMVRKSLTEKYDDQAYTNGLIVKTTIVDRNQNAANQALTETLYAYDKRHGYRGAEARIEGIETKSDEERAALMRDFPVIANLYPALVTQVNKQSVKVYMSSLGEINIHWDGLKWARKYISVNRRGKTPKVASDILAVGDVIRLIETETGDWLLSQLPAVQGSLVSMDPNNGAIMALVGGFNFYRNKFNRVTQAKRQPGSGFKPFIYSAAIAANKTAATLINDAPIVLEDPAIGEQWRPENYSKKNYGPTRLREALTHSRNLVSIRLLNLIGLPVALQHLQNFGFDTAQLPHNLSLALGSGEVTPLQLARGYSVFANGGFLIDPYYIDEINTYYNESLFKANPPTVCIDCIDEAFITRQANELDSTTVDSESFAPIAQKKIAPRTVDAQTIWIMNSMTRDVIKYGTGRRALKLKRTDLSGKTGTTNEQHDAWFSGFNANVVTITWVGFDKFAPLGRNETGASAALPMWIHYMGAALDGMPESIMQKPKGLINIRIDPQTGQATNSNNPKAIFEVFKAENAARFDATESSDESLQNPESDSISIQLF